MSGAGEMPSSCWGAPASAWVPITHFLVEAEAGIKGTYPLRHRRAFEMSGWLAIIGFKAPKKFSGAMNSFCFIEIRYHDQGDPIRRLNQSILKEISPGCSLEGLMLKLKLQYFGTWCEELTHWKRPWCWGRLKVGGEGDDRGWDGWMASPTRQTRVWASSGS